MPSVLSVPIPRDELVFCNRCVNMESIRSIGFDMDYTLVLYNTYSFERLVYAETLKKMVAHGYPEEILSWELDQNCMIRGLVIDKKRGNILKLDRHNYVKIAYHGFTPLTQNERRSFYDIEKIIFYKEPDFAFLDTFFSLAEAFLLSKLVEFKDNHGTLNHKSYEDLYFDVRKYLDLSHRDDNLKNIISRNPEKYILRDARLPNILSSLKKSGKKLFILTNSLWDYVNPIMSYLLPQSPDTPNILSWIDYFDFVMTGAQKPQFFSSKNLMYEVDPSNGFLKNLPSSPFLLHASKIFQGGHVNQLHRMLGVSRGSEILYVGDHIYGDILRSKKNIGWRTMLLIEELEAEMKEKYHPIWGSLMKTGNHNSFFSEQVSQYACLYSTKFTNFIHYHENKKFEAMPDVMPHDLCES